MGPSDGSIPGLYLLAAHDIIECLNQYQDLELHVSFYEIYCGKLYDLLNDRELIHAREDNKQEVKIMGLTSRQVTLVEDLMMLI